MNEPERYSESFAASCEGRVVPVTYDGEVIGTATLSVSAPGLDGSGPAVVADLHLTHGVGGLR